MLTTPSTLKFSQLCEDLVHGTDDLNSAFHQTFLISYAHSKAVSQPENVSSTASSFAMLQQHILKPLRGNLQERQNPSLQFAADMFGHGEIGKHFEKAKNRCQDNRFTSFYIEWRRNEAPDGGGRTEARHGHDRDRGRGGDDDGDDRDNRDGRYTGRNNPVPILRVKKKRGGGKFWTS